MLTHATASVTATDFAAALDSIDVDGGGGGGGGGGSVGGDSAAGDVITQGTIHRPTPGFRHNNGSGTFDSDAVKASLWRDEARSANGERQKATGEAISHLQLVDRMRQKRGDVCRRSGLRAGDTMSLTLLCFLSC